jgi:YggT family protein
VTATVLILADARGKVADYVQALAYVYFIIIFAYILSQWYLSFGGRVPYSGWSSALLGFLRDVSEPYLRVFRKFIPPIGAFDFSPMIAIILLYIVQSLIVNAIRG